MLLRSGILSIGRVVVAKAQPDFILVKDSKTP